MKAKLPKLVTVEYMDEMIQRLDMLALLVLHNEFGFGPVRLKRYYEGIYELSKYYKKFTDGEPEYGKKSKDGKERLELWKLRRDLKEIGFDYEAEINKPVE